MDKSLTGKSGIAPMIWKVGSPIIFAIGVFGNITTLAVLIHRNNRKSSTAVYLTGLALADLLITLNTLPRWFIIYAFGMDVRLLSDFGCRLHRFLTGLGGRLSSAFLVAVTVERIISTTRPYTVRRICTEKNGRFIVCLIAFIAMALDSHIVYGFSLMFINGNQIKASNGSGGTSENYSAAENKMLPLSEMFNITPAVNDTTGNWTDELLAETAGSAQMCVGFADPKYAQFYDDVYLIYTMTSYNIIPQLVFLIGGIIIIRKLAFSRRFRKQMTVNQSSSLEGPTRVRLSRFDSRSTQVTITLLVVNLVFFICTTPLMIFLNGISYWVDMETGMTETQEIVWAVCNMLYFSNHAINFILYVVSGSRFRKDVIELFSCRKQKREQVSSSVPTISAKTSIATTLSEMSYF